MEPIEWTKAGEVALSLLRRFWYVVPMAALAIALLVTRGTLSRREHTIAAQTQTISNLNARNAITQGSLTGALTALAKQTADAKAAEARLQADRQSAAAAQATNAERARSTDATIADLQASAHSPHTDRCAASPAARRALEAL